MSPSKSVETRSLGSLSNATTRWLATDKSLSMLKSNIVLTSSNLNQFSKSLKMKGSVKPNCVNKMDFLNRKLAKFHTVQQAM